MFLWSEYIFFVRSFLLHSASLSEEKRRPRCLRCWLGCHLPPATEMRALPRNHLRHLERAARACSGSTFVIPKQLFSFFFPRIKAVFSNNSCSLVSCFLIPTVKANLGEDHPRNTPVQYLKLSPSHHFLFRLESSDREALESHMESL